jgi:EAL domain-containing protein (putative c-di-GMP-specific phosphodiesterase class I)
VRVAIDDIGLGYDVVEQLQGLPLDLINLDATISGAGVDAARTEAMRQSLLDVCERIGLTVIARGIATKEQATALRAMGCKIGQGELYGAGAEVAADGEGGDGESEDCKIGRSKAKVGSSCRSGGGGFGS